MRKKHNHNWQKKRGKSRLRMHDLVEQGTRVPCPCQGFPR